jgi:membrane protein
MVEGMRGRLFAKRLIRRSLAEFGDDHCAQLAASISYHVLFPLAIVIAAVSSIVLNSTGSQHATVDTIVGAVPLSDDGRAQLRHLLLGATGNLSAIGLVGLAGLVYSASGVMATVRTALNEAWDVEQVRPFLRGKVVDVGLVFLVAMLSLGALGATIVLHVVGDGLLVFSIVVPLVVSFGIVLFLYRVVPAAEVSVRDAWPAALFVAVTFTAAENLFAVYVRHFGNYNAIYGSLGGVIAFMFFVFLSSELFLLGAEVASEWPRVRRALEDGEAPEDDDRRTGGLRAALLGLWVHPARQEATVDDSTSRPPDRRDRETATRGGDDVDPHRPGGDGDRGSSRRVGGRPGGRGADHGHG